ncbi:MAG: glutamate 5-kinase [Rhodospirillales bacterium]|nr:glutamate 5-kinase [Rhodospirillales bacterium]
MNRAAADSAHASLASAKRVVVKIGSALLVDQDSGALKHAWLEALADDLARLKGRGTEVIVVSSGAIALGRRHLGLTRKAIRLEEQQAAAATGQIRLAHAYQSALARHHVTVAQILLTLADTEERRRHLNARNTLATLLGLGTVPVINENDTVATSEIRFGDNDRLAARVAAMMNADTMILLSDIDGLYSADPRKDAMAEFIAEVPAITPQIEAMAGTAPLGYSSGGMVTKLAAGKIATAAGCRMAIVDGRQPHPIAALEAGARCTWFLAEMEPLTARKRWIAGSLNPTGKLVVDAGALAALKRGRSLLPAGVTAVEGRFERGDAVLVVGPEGGEVGRGLVAYSDRDARLILGYKSGEIEARLGYRGREELIHRDDLVLTSAV